VKYPEILRNLAKIWAEKISVTIDISALFHLILDQITWNLQELQLGH